jgi:hypothetical protein
MPSPQRSARVGGEAGTGIRTIYGLEVSGLGERLSKQQVGCGGLLLRLFMKFLRLLLQLFEASLSIDVDGILCDLALRIGLLAGCPAIAGCRRNGRTAKWCVSDSTYEIEALFERLRRLHTHVSPLDAWSGPCAGCVPG